MTTIPEFWRGPDRNTRAVPGADVRRPRLMALIMLLSLLVVAGCATRLPPPPPQPAPAPAEDREVVESEVREPARQSSEGVQVFPLQNPAVKELLAGAQQSESAGQYDQAAVSLERALRIEPRDPEILQHMAEIQLQKKDYQQALNFATRSYDSGPRVGEICSRNWRTISVARARLEDAQGAADARSRADQCMNAKPSSY